MATTSELLSLDDVYRARERIADRLHRTPLLSSATLSSRTDADVHFKAELFQRTGSFKPRGVLNKLATLSAEEKERGVISISAGNHAQALAYASAVEGIDALVVMWQTASPMKIAAARGYGATIDTEAPDIPTAFERLEELIERPAARSSIRTTTRSSWPARARSGSRSSRTSPTPTSSSSRSAAAGSSPGSRPRSRERAGHPAHRRRARALAGAP